MLLEEFTKPQTPGLCKLEPSQLKLYQIAITFNHRRVEHSKLSFESCKGKHG